MYGLGVYIGFELCCMYCVEWNVWKVNFDKKLCDDNNLVIGLILNLV